MKASCSSHVSTSELTIKPQLFFFMQIFFFFHLNLFLIFYFYNAKQITRCESNFPEHEQRSTCRVLLCSPVGWWWWRLHRCQRRWDTAQWTNAHQMFLEACLRSDNPILPSPHPSETVLSCLNISKKTENVTMHHKMSLNSIQLPFLCIGLFTTHCSKAASYEMKISCCKKLHCLALQSYEMQSLWKSQKQTALPLKMTLNSKSFFLYTCVLMLDVHHNETWSNMFVYQKRST